MRRKRREEQHERLEQRARASLELGQLVREHHHLGDGGVELQRLEILRDLLDRLVQQPPRLDRGRFGRHRAAQASVLFHVEPPHPVEEARDALHTRRAPRLHGLERAHEHLVEAHGVRPVLVDDLVGGDHVAPRLGHLAAVLPLDDALMDELHERLDRAHSADVVEHLVPEARIQQVEHSMLRPAHVEIDRHPVLLERRVHGGALVPGR